MKRPYELPRRPHAALVPAARGVRSGITAQLEDELRARGSRRQPGCPATLWSSAPPKPSSPHLETLVLSGPLSPCPAFPPMRSPPSPSAHLAGFGLLWASVSPLCGPEDPGGETLAPRLASGPGTCINPAGRNVGPPALGVAGQRTQAGWPGRGDGLGDPARAGLRADAVPPAFVYPATSVPGTEQLPARAVAAIPAPWPPPRSRPPEAQELRNLRCGARFRPAPFPRDAAAPRAPAPPAPAFPAPPARSSPKLRPRRRRPSRGEARAARDLGPLLRTREAAAPAAAPDAAVATAGPPPSGLLSRGHGPAAPQGAPFPPGGGPCLHCVLGGGAPAPAAGPPPAHRRQRGPLHVHGTAGGGAARPDPARGAAWRARAAQGL
ncbi:skin secretory protein xP2 isoform X2 [Ovis aries]|uniref:skin secretory protein xP2 isoform X2 n=1 Tax=Ovis aries TaxID=9940 RepID=UPI001C2E0991|nr:skin secretory protein xP2 isoform X2 [Ovis aries]